MRRNLLVSTPRTGSNLLMRLLNLDEQDDVTTEKQRSYFFLGAMKFQVDDENCCKPLKDWSPEERDGLFAVHQSAVEALQAAVQHAESEGKDIFVKEHAVFLLEPVTESLFLHGPDSTDEKPWTATADGVSTSHTTGNPTALPDEFLKTWRPTILIRHPGISLPSFQRVTTEIYGETKANFPEIRTIGTTLHWSRMVYDFFASDDPDHGPIVLDADDFITDTELLRDYARAVGLNPDKLKFDWEVTSDEVRNNFPSSIQTMAASLWDSSKIVKMRETKEINIDEEAKKWKEKFGGEVAKSLEERVRDAMPNYEYLHSKRFRRQTTTS